MDWLLGVSQCITRIKEFVVDEEPGIGHSRQRCVDDGVLITYTFEMHTENIECVAMLHDVVLDALFDQKITNGFVHDNHGFRRTLKQRLKRLYMEMISVLVGNEHNVDM